jgi:very-short-patch-repair endonuclease
MRAKTLRRNATLAERILWSQLRNKNFCNIKFRRQHPIGRYIVDFFAADVNLVIELDGDSHEGKQSYDMHRQNILVSYGLKVLRFSNEEIYNNLDGVLVAIEKECSYLQEDDVSYPTRHMGK